MTKIIKLALFLSVVCVISAGILSYTNSITAPIIAQNKQVTLNKMLNEVVSDADEFQTEAIGKDGIVNVHKAMKAGEVISYIYEISVFGFQSQITALVSIDTDGNYNGFKVVSYAETPGYGDVIEKEPYINQFTTKTVDDEIDTVAGSTVTTMPVKLAIEAAAAHFIENFK